MAFEITRSLDYKIWREFVDEHPQGNIFHTPDMYQVFERAQGYRPLIWAAISDHGQLLALLNPVQVTLTVGLPRRLTTRSIAYGGLLCSPNPVGKEALLTLLDAYSQKARKEALFTELRHLSDFSELQPLFLQCGFTYEDHLDYLIDISCGPEQVLQNIGPRTRKHIRQAIRKGNVSVEQITDRNQIQTWYEIVCRSYKAAHVPLADRSLFEAAFDILQPVGMVKFWLAKFGSAYIAASMELLYKDVMYGWYGGMDRAYAEELPGELLMWHILDWGARSGYKTYDFGGAGKPGEEYGVRDFKSKFGGQLVCFGRNTNVHSPNLFHLSEFAYRFYRRLLP
jgi:serine/alanine adding enzyme